MATITTLEGMTGRPRLAGRARRFLGATCPVDDAKLIDEIMAKYAAMAKANGNVLTWEMNVARGKEIQVVQDAYMACVNQEEARTQAQRIAEEQAAASRAAAAAAAQASEAAAARARSQQASQSNAAAAAAAAAASAAAGRAAAAAASAAASRAASEAAKRKAAFEAEGWNRPSTPSNGPGLLPPVSTTPPLITTAAPVDVAVEPAPEGEAPKKASFILPLVALGAAYLFLKG